jgi:hypothetical protein
MWYESAGAEFFGNANRTAAEHAMQEELEAASETLSVEEQSTLKMNWGKQLRDSSDSSIKDLIPLIHGGGVDMYVAGHWHYYESLYPAMNGATGTGGKPTQKDYNNPKVTVHVTTGNGGPPSADNFNEDCPGPDCGSIPSTRAQSVRYGALGFRHDFAFWRSAIRIHDVAGVEAGPCA